MMTPSMQHASRYPINCCTVHCVVQVEMQPYYDVAHLQHLSKELNIPVPYVPSTTHADTPADASAFASAVAARTAEQLSRVPSHRSDLYANFRLRNLQIVQLLQQPAEWMSH
eukprot:6727939-Pyramimonas_sp.AAC.1